MRCATAQIASSLVGMYEYMEINMVGVFAGLQLYVGYDVVNTFIKQDYSGVEAIQEDVYCDFKILLFMYSYFQFCTHVQPQVIISE